MIKTKHFHIIYLSLIALSTFFYFTKRNRTDALYEHLSDSLTHSSNALSKLTEGAYSGILTNVEIEPQRHEKYLDLAKFINATTEKFIAELDKPMNESQINKDSCEQFQKKIYKQIVINRDSYDTSYLKEKSAMNYVLNQNSFWDKTSKISNAGLAAKVKTIRNNAIIDKAMLMNYCLDKSSVIGLYAPDPFRVYILPHKMTYFEDDSVDIDIFIGVSYKQSYSEGIYANGNFLKSKYGVSLIRIKNLETGKHKIDLSTTERSHFDGKIDTIRDVFHYEVLPQCGKNCNSNQ
jgi:hypothetical protein